MSSGTPAASQPIGVVGPGLGQVELAVDHRVPAGAGVGQVDRDLGVLDPPGGAGVLALHPDGVHALLEVAGLVDHQHRRRRRRARRRRSRAGRHARRRCPSSPGQQVLHAVRIGVAGVLGDASSSSCAAGPPAARARTRGRGGGSPPGRTGPPSDRAACRLRHSIRRPLRCGPRPPLDPLDVDTTEEDHAVAVPRPGPPRRKITNYGWSTRAG